MSENEAYVDPDNVDALLASELNEMTLNERETLYEEIHGVEQQREESEEFLENSLRAMDDALRQLPDRQVYEKAANINPEYVEDRAFRLMFLRSENFEAVLAARRLVKFLEGKVRFFGEDTLARPIYLSDFNDDDMAFFKSGIIQTIPSRDRSGRPIFADFNMNPNVGQPKHVDSYVCFKCLKESFLSSTCKYHLTAFPSSKLIE